MDSANQGSGSDGEEAARKGKYHRHSAEQIQQLEDFFKEFPHPDENQRQKLSKDLGLDAKQIKFWFQNKRTQRKAQNEKADNNAIRAENERIRCENLAMKEALKGVLCHACRGSVGPSLGHGEEEMQPTLVQTLRLENEHLKEEHQKTLNFFSYQMGKSPMPMPGIEHLSVMSRNRILGGGVCHEQIPRHTENPISPYPLSGVQEIDKSGIIETAIASMEELVQLLRLKEPVWIKSPIDGRHMIHSDNYDKLFPKPNHFKSASARMESSKYSGEVAMAAMHLVEMLIDSNKRKEIFPTMITKARTIEELDPGSFGGSIHLMYEKMHVLSPLVAPREFFFIRYSRQLSSSTWVIVDVSYDFIKQLQDAAPTRSWKLPSGCTIEDVSNGKSIVTWIEHVQVDDKSLTHRLYRDLVFGSHAYGAKRWIATLQRMCERYAFSMGLTTAPNHKVERVIDTTGGRSNVLRLSQRMITNYSEMLSMSDRLDFPHLSELNNSGVRVSLRKSTGHGEPGGLIVSAASSLWLPYSKEDLFNFFRDLKKRAKWDVLCNGSPASEIAQITTGTYPGNSISIVQPFVPSANNLLMLQESSIDALGAFIIYAPVDLETLTSIISGVDTTKVPILPSGYVISSDVRATKEIGTSSSSSGSSGSLLTVAYQILVCCNSLSKQLNMQSVATVHTLISSTIQKIKVALGCSELD